MNHTTQRLTRATAKRLEIPIEIRISEIAAPKGKSSGYLKQTFSPKEDLMLTRSLQRISLRHLILLLKLLLYSLFLGNIGRSTLLFGLPLFSIPCSQINSLQ